MRDELGRIVGVQLQGLQRRLEDRRLTLDVTDAAKAWLAHRGSTRSMGRVRCDGLSRLRSATRWHGRSWLARCPTARRCSWMRPKATSPRRWSSNLLNEQAWGCSGGDPLS